MKPVLIVVSLSRVNQWLLGFRAFNGRFIDASIPDNLRYLLLVAEASCKHPVPPGFHGYCFVAVLAAAKSCVPAVQQRLSHHLRELPHLVYGGEGEDGGREEVSQGSSRSVCRNAAFKTRRETLPPYAATGTVASTRCTFKKLFLSKEMCRRCV